MSHASGASANIIKMSTKEEHFCRLCLKLTKDEFQIDEVMREMLEILLLKLDLNISRDPIICQDCMDVAKKCLQFKYTFVNTEEIILSHFADKKQIKYDIKVIYEWKKHVRTALDADFIVCRFCLSRLERYNFASLDTLTNESPFDMLSEYVVEMDFNTIENPGVCPNCEENLAGYFKFVLTCLDIEEKIKAYWKKKGTDNMGQVELCNVLFMLTDALEYPEKSSQIYKIQQEQTPWIYPEGYIKLIKHEEVGIKDEEMILCNNSYQNPSEIKINKNEDTSSPKEYGKEIRSDMISLNTREHNIEWHTHQTMCIDGKNKKKHVKSDLANNSDASETETEVKQRLVSKNHASTDRMASEPKRKHKVTNHMSVLEDMSYLQSYIPANRNICPMYKCSLCTYEAKQKNRLRTHMLIHKNVSEIEMYKCSLCTYEAKHKPSIKRHMLIHKDVSEIKMYKCSFCAYEAKQKHYIRRHMLVHKDISEIKIYKCSLCTYEAKQKSHLRTHMLVHKDVSEIKMYKCSLCTYEAKHKQNISSHMLVHKDDLEIKMYECSLCTYEAKHKSNLNKHMLIHKNVSEIKMYKCSLCTYEAKYKSNLNTHMLIHKDVSEIKMYKCSLCTYEGKHKVSLNTHMLVHKDVAEIEMYKCSLCTYEAKQKSNLTTHMLVHKDISEIKMHKCSFCTYEAKHKISINRHMLIHKDVSEIKMYKCSLCAYEARQKSNLKRHILVHKNI